jgi:hypothetical protein
MTRTAVCQPLSLLCLALGPAGNPSSCAPLPIHLQPPSLPPLSDLIHPLPDLLPLVAPVEEAARTAQQKQAGAAVEPPPPPLQIRTPRGTKE